MVGDFGTASVVAHGAMTTDTGALREALLDGFRSTLDSVLPWFMSQMPAAYFADTDERERLGRSELERKNAALSELLSRIELEKAGIRSAMRSAFEERVSPLVAGLAGVAAASGRREEAARLEARIRRELDVMLSRGAPLADDPRMRLSVRELEVCDLVASGLSSKEIAELLSIAASTVERHRHNARRKLGMPAREGSLSTAIARNDRDL